MDPNDSYRLEITPTNEVGAGETLNIYPISVLDVQITSFTIEDQVSPQAAAARSKTLTKLSTTYPNRGTTCAENARRFSSVMVWETSSGSFGVGEGRHFATTDFCNVDGRIMLNNTDFSSCIRQAQATSADIESTPSGDVPNSEVVVNTFLCEWKFVVDSKVAAELSTKALVEGKISGSLEAALVGDGVHQIKHTIRGFDTHAVAVTEKIQKLG